MILLVKLTGAKSPSRTALHYDLRYPEPLREGSQRSFQEFRSNMVFGAMLTDDVS
ncbi:MAG: hypothetical protein OXH86_18810 [Acidimicrobiaceae bacterium]|nr:hypothetical protein [Acidimicrobiaceae bacterium]